MSKIILQPAGSADASEHYADTIAIPVNIDEIARFLDEEKIVHLRELHKDGTVPTWGVTPGQDNGNHKKWKRVQPGDIVLFSRDKKIFASASVSFVTHNKDLALKLWGTDPKGQTWEYMYFLDEVLNQDISYEEFNKAADYKPNFVIQGFNVLEDDKSEAIIKYFELGSETYYPSVSKEEYFEALRLDPSKSLEKEGIVKGRTEQAFLRNALFRGKKYSVCGICGNDYPVAFLVTAHIKKRANCTDEEKRDFKNVVMPMCKFGCDELYEKGYLGVEDGFVVSLRTSDMTEAVSSYINKLHGRKCDAWNVNTSKYFQWHLEKFK